MKYYFGDGQELSTAQSTALRKAAALRTRKRHEHQILNERRVKLGRENLLSGGLVKSCFDTNSWSQCTLILLWSWVRSKGVQIPRPRMRRAAYAIIKVVDNPLVKFSRRNWPRIQRDKPRAGRMSLVLLTTFWGFSGFRWFYLSEYWN